MGGNAAVARVLVEHGADVNRRDSEGKTVMMVRWCLLEVSLTPAVSSSHVSSGSSVRTTRCSSHDVCTCITRVHTVMESGGHPSPGMQKKRIHNTIYVILVSGLLKLEI